jgi:hypothetical protein
LSSHQWPHLVSFVVLVEPTAHVSVIMEASIRRHIFVAIVLMASHRAVPLAAFMSSSSFVESSARPASQLH